MNQQTLQTLFIEQIRDLYDAQTQLVKALPKLAEAAQSEQLTEALRSHLEQTQNHLSRLENVFELIGVGADSKSTQGMKGLVEEGNEAVQEEENGSLRDFAIIAGAAALFRGLGCCADAFGGQ